MTRSTSHQIPTCSWNIRVSESHPQGAFAPCRLSRSCPLRGLHRSRVYTKTRSSTTRRVSSCLPAF